MNESESSSHHNSGASGSALSIGPLLAEAALFRMLVENVTDTIFLIDLESEVCLYVSPAVAALLGRDPESIIGRPLIDFVHADDTAEVLARSARRREGKGARTTVTRMSHSDGGWVWVQTAASPVLQHEGRSAAVFTVTGTADRVRAEVGLRSARLRLRRLLEQVGTGHNGNGNVGNGHVGNGDEFLQTQDGTFDSTVEALAAALELRDDETGQHTRRVTDLALALTRKLDPALASEPELRYGFLLHDIGKIGIPDSILMKPGRLTSSEMQRLRIHTALGEHLLSFIPFLSHLVHDVVAYHHERWDGTGYPWGLRGDDIPLAARIFAVADAFDALTNDRPYRKARSVSAAIHEILRCAGSQFDPTVVKAFEAVASELDAGHASGIQASVP